MARLILVRHGQAAHGWEDADPGLDDVGRRQAEDLAEELAPIGPLPLVTSPLRRCRETAAPLAEAWGLDATVEPAVRELPSPPGVAVEDRPAWLREAISHTWSELGDAYGQYRAELLGTLAAMTTDTVVVSHFLAINAAVGAAVGDHRLVVLSLDNTSRTILDVDGGRFRLVEGGAEADTLLR